MTTARCAWSRDNTGRWYVIRCGERTQTIPIGRRYPAHTAAYVARVVAALNGESHEQ